MITRRSFMHTTLALGSGLVLPSALAQGAALTAAPSSALAHDPRRPRFHLLPARNWMNDPNGPIFFEGHYHMFMQYNPHGPTWGNMSWNHAISPDMLHWTHEPLALTQTPGGPDAAGCYTGSCIAATENGHKRVYAIYTGVVKDTVHPTILGEGLRESQCLAWSDDPELRTWTKQPTPILPTPPPGLHVTGFRDPSVWRGGDVYYMTVGSGIAGVGGCMLLYRSRDLHHWEYLHVLTQGLGAGKPAENPVGNGEMWECPDFFALDGGHILIYSTMGEVFWQSGTLDEATMLFHPRRTGLLDFDAFYAPKTQLDADGRRILWGWIPERRPQAATVEAGWAGMISLPRVLSLDKDGAVRITFLPAMATLRADALPQPASNTATLPEASGELQCTGTRGKGFRVQLTAGTEPLLQVVYDAAKHSFTVDDKSIVLEHGDEPTLHAYADGSVVEVLLAGRVGCTKRFYAAGAKAPDLHVQADAAALGLWAMTPISTDRLTTPAHAS